MKRMTYVDVKIEKDAREIGEDVKKYYETLITLTSYYETNVNKDDFYEFEDWLHEVAEIVL